jgi:hypothetical protein
MASGKTSARHVSAIKLIQGNENSTESLKKWAAKDEGEFVVEEIQKHSGPLSQLKRCQFLIKWEGYPQDQASWEPYENIKQCEALNAYISSYKASRKPKAKPEEANPKDTNTTEANHIPNQIQPIEKTNKGGYGLRPGVEISGDQ